MKWYDHVGVASLPIFLGVIISIFVINLYPEDILMQLGIFLLFSVPVTLLGIWHDYSLLKRGK